MTDNVYTPRRTVWDVKWNGVGLGTSMEVDPSLKLRLEPITRGTTGSIILGHWIQGLEGSIKCTLPDVTALLISTLSPWFATPQPLHPTAYNINLYDLAQPLILHPHDMLTDVTQDLHFPKAAPSNPVSMKRDGTKDDVWVVEFMIYSDLAQLMAATPKIVQGYQGATAP